MALPDSRSRNGAAAAHVLPYVGLLVPPIGAILAPLILLLLDFEDEAFVRAHVMSTVNYILVWTMVWTVIATFTCGLGLLLAIPLLPVSLLIDLLAVMAGLEGREFRYPLTPVLLK